MKREFAKPIAEALGALLIAILALVAWIVGARAINWPSWVLFAVLVSAAALITYAAIKLAKRFT